MKKPVEGKDRRVNVDKTKGMQLLFGKSSVSSVDPCGAFGEQVACNSIRCTKCQRWVHRRCSDVPRHVSLLSSRDVFVCRTCLGHSCSVEEKLDFKRDEDVLEEVEKFSYLGDMISCYGEASEAVSARIGSAGFITEATGGNISVVLDQFCFTVVKRGNLLLRMRRACVGWSIV